MTTRIDPPQNESSVDEVRYFIACACGRRWDVTTSKGSSFTCKCGMRYYDIWIKPGFRFNVDPDGVWK